MELKDTFLSDIHSQSDTHSKAQNWLEYLNHASYLITDNAIEKYPITSFKQFLCIGIRLLLEDELVIKNANYAADIFVRNTLQTKNTVQEYTETHPQHATNTPVGNPIRKNYSATQFIRNLQNLTTDCMPAFAEANCLLTRPSWIN